MAKSVTESGLESCPRTLCSGDFPLAHCLFRAILCHHLLAWLHARATVFIPMICFAWLSLGILSTVQVPTGCLSVLLLLIDSREDPTALLVGQHCSQPEGINMLALILLHLLMINSIWLWLFLHAVTPPRHLHAKLVLCSFVLVEIWLCNCF